MRTRALGVRTLRGPTVRNCEHSPFPS
jgi:hypothetical protein